MKKTKRVTVNHQIEWSRVLIYSILLIFWLVFYWHLCVTVNGGDYYAHNMRSEYIKEGKTSFSFYPLYHMLVIALSYLLANSSCAAASAVLLAFAMVVSIEIIRRLITALVESEGMRLPWVAGLLAALLVSIIQPIFTFAIRPGYSSGNGYISPTQAVVKPFALMSIYYTWKLLEKGQTLRRQMLLTVFLVLSCLAKPMFAMAFIPAMGIYYFVDNIKKYKISIRAIREYLISVWPLFLSGLVLIAQYCMKLFCSTDVMSEILNNEGYDGKSRIMLGWMTAWSKVVSSVPLSILFAYLGAIVFLILYRKNIENKKYWYMTALYTAVSFIYISCLYESGVYMTDLNFRNSWIISFLLIYIGCFAELCSIGMNIAINMNNAPITENSDNTNAGPRFSLRQFIWEVIKDKKYLASLLCMSVHLLFGLALIAKNLIV